MAEISVKSTVDKNDISVRIGDKDSAEFIPKLSISKWEDEVGFSVTHILPQGQRNFTVKDNNIYELDTSKFTFIFYPKENAYEFEVVLKEKPPTNSISFSINKKDLNFYYQPPLTEEFKVGDNFHGRVVGVVTETDVLDTEGKLLIRRPINVVGSYAVYHATKKNDYTKRGGKNYGTGKVCHIYRPELTDAEGKKVWAELKIEGNTLTITAPQEFLDSAVYPVIVDPTFGYTTEGGSPLGMTADEIMSTPYALSEAGTAETIHVYAQTGSGTVNMQLGIYDPDDPRNLMGNTASISITTTAQWYQAAAANTAAMVAENHYLCVNVAASGHYVYCDSGSVATSYKAQTFGTWPTTLGSWSAWSNYDLSIYVTYGTGGGTFGSEDTTNSMGYSAGNILGSGYALSEEGEVTKITLRVRAQSGTANVQCAIYDGNTRKGYSGSVNCDTTAAWVDFELLTPVTLPAGTYRLCFNCEAAVYVYYADAGATGYEDQGVSFGTWPETADFGSAGTLPLAIYATYGDVEANPEITFINEASAVTSGATSITVGKPTDTAENDVMVAHIFIEDTADRVNSVPTGWVEVVNATVGTRAIRQHIYRKVAGASEPSNYTWGLSSSEEIVGQILTFRGVDTSSPIGNTSTSTDTASGEPVAPTIDVQRAYNWVIFAAGNARGTTYTAPTNYTERSDDQTGTGVNNISATMATREYTSTGATGNITGDAAATDYFVASLIELKAYVPPSVLVINNGSHSLTSDSPVLSLSAIVLVISDPSFALTSESLSLTQVHVLAINDSSCSLTSENISLVQLYILSIDDSILATVSDEPTLTRIFILIISDSSPPISAESVALIEHKTLSINDASHALSGEALALIEYKTLIIADSSLSISSESPVLVEGVTLSIDDASLTLTSESISLTVSLSLVISDSSHVLSSESLDLIEHKTLSINDASLGLTSESLDLVEHKTLAINDASLGLTSEEPVLTVSLSLTVNDASLGVTFESLDLVEHKALSINDSFLGLISESLDLIEHKTISISDASLELTSESLDLVEHKTLSINDASLELTSESLDLVEGKTLSINDTSLGLTSESLVLVIDTLLIINDASLGLTVESLDLVEGKTLSINDSSLSTTSESLDLIEHKTLSINDASLELISESPVLVIDIFLSIEDSSLGLTSESLDLIEHKTLSINDASLELTSEEPVLIIDTLLAIDDASSAVTSESPILITDISIIISNSSFELTSESLDLIEYQTLVIQDASHVLSSDNIDLIGAGSLNIHAGNHALTSDSLNLIEHKTLSINDASLVLTSESPVLFEVQTLSINDSSLGLTAESLILIVDISLVISDSSSGLTSDALDLVEHKILSITDASLGLTSESPALITDAILIISDTVFVLTSESLDLVEYKTLTIQDTSLVLSSDSLNLISGMFISIFDSSLSLSSEAIDLIEHKTLVIQDASHALFSESPDLIEYKTLSIQNAEHNLISDSINLIQGLLLAIQDADLSSLSDNLNLERIHILSINDGQHELTSETNLVLIVYYTLENLDASLLVTADNIDLIYFSTLEIDDSILEVTSDNVNLVDFIIENVLMGMSSDNIVLIETYHPDISKVKLFFSLKHLRAFKRKQQKIFISEEHTRVFKRKHRRNVMHVVYKRPSEKLQIGIDFQPPTIEGGTTILSSTQTVSPSKTGGLTLVGASIISGTSVRQFVNGGVQNNDYKVTFVTLLSTQEILEEVIMVRVI